MSKKIKKKKVNLRVFHAQKHQQKKHLENKLYRNIIRFAKACNVYEELCALPSGARAYMKIVQFRSVLVRAEKGSGISDAVISAIKKDLTNYLQTKTISLDGSNVVFTLFDIVTAGATLWQMSKFEKNASAWEDIYDGIGALRKIFEEKEDDHIFNIIGHTLQDIVSIHSHVDKSFFWFRWNLKCINNHFTTVYTINREACVRKQVVIDKKLRPVFRVGYAMPYEGMRWSTIKGEELVPFYENIDSKKEFPVFIQSHALIRMKERLYPIPDCDELLYVNLLNCKVSRSPAGHMLISVEKADCKVGYLLTYFTGDELIIRTFLFITNTGTFEGDAFDNHLGVEVYSKKYFKLDSLSTYIATDICTDPFFISILNKCGCNGLVEFKQYFLNHKNLDENISKNLREVLALNGN